MKYILFLFILAAPAPVLAAEIFFGTHSEEIGLGQQFEVGVFLNTQEQEVNAVGGTILFSSDALKLEAIYEGSSVVSFWVQKPALRQQGEIVFSGVMPGGIEDGKGFLFSLVFLAKEEANVTFKTIEEKILLNDGQGTAAMIQRAPATLRITKTAIKEEFVLLLDNEAPESFTPQIARDPNIFEGKWFLVFAAQDKISGIANYSVLETTRAEIGEAPKWLTVKSPYLLRDQELKSYVFVKALDKAGNERIATLLPQNPRQWYENLVLWGIVTLLFLVFLTMLLYLAIKKKRLAKNILHLCIFVVSFLLFGVVGTIAEAATLSVGPTGGTFTVGSTFNVSVFLDTKEEAINVIGVSLSFPPDKLQVISPSIGQSIIGVWTAAPSVNNQAGRIQLQGGIPRGITTSNGLITTVTFRVISVGDAFVKFLDDSMVLLHDGVGTDALSDTRSGIYELILPPPAGPSVISQTHPDQSVWYPNPNITFKWVNQEDVDGYSWVFNKEPVDIPDDIIDGSRTTVGYTSLQDGIYYFHIKAFRRQSWGGVTHFAVKIDASPPAEFPIDIEGSNRTVNVQPSIRFATTDVLSGMDYYTLKIVPLSLNAMPLDDGASLDQPLFIEIESPYVVSPLELGTYDVIVRAYDKAGNLREVTKRFSIVTSPFQFIRGEGLQITSTFLIPWNWFWILSALLIFSLLYIGLRVAKWHRDFDIHRAERKLPKHVKEQLEELKNYRKKYGSKIAVLLFFLLGLAFGIQPVLAQEAEFAPPLITTISRDISNNEIFYVGGKTGVSFGEVILYLQNLRTGETFSYNIVSDRQGDWFYRHDAFLSSGGYQLWTQGRVADQLSPPSPQIQITVGSTAIQFGASRISYEVLYLIFVIILLFVLLGLFGYIVFHVHYGRKESARLIKEVREAEEAVRRGFAVLRRDIEAELAFVNKLKLSKTLSDEENAMEERLLKDFKEVERYIGKEIWDIEKEID
ncbi:hypothetical protein IIB97_00710 [Patescibacteria group bacterium]|nr:hypothetical protein [Patescibacteria group bacterium]